MIQKPTPLLTLQNIAMALLTQILIVLQPANSNAPEAIKMILPVLMTAQPAKLATKIVWQGKKNALKNAITTEAAINKVLSPTSGNVCQAAKIIARIIAQKITAAVLTI